MVADPQSGVQSGVARKVCRHFHILTRHRKGHLGGVVCVRGRQEGVCFLLLIAYLHRPADEVLSLRRNGCQVHGFTHRHSAAARYGRIAVVNVRSHMVADVQRGIPLKVCLYFHVLSRHDKAHFGGVVRVRGQEGVRVLLNTIHLHRPVDKALVGFRLPARCCYSIALSSFGLIHSAVYSFDVIRNIAIIRFRLNIIGGHGQGQGRGGGDAILQQLGKFCFVRDFTLSITYIIQLPACKCLSFGSISGSQNHFSACGHRSLQFFSFALKLCSGIVCGHSVQRTHIAAGVAVSICCIGVIMVSPLFIRLTRAVCGSAHPPVFGSVMFPPVIMPMHIQYDIHFLVLSDIIIVVKRLGIGINRKDISIDCAVTCSSCFACVKFSRQSGKVKLSITFNCNIIAAVLPTKRRQSRMVLCIQRRQICIRNKQRLQLRVRTYIQYTQWIFPAF